MPHRRLVPLIAALAAAGVAASCSPGQVVREQSAAIRLDDATVSRSDFEDMLDLVYENEDLRDYLFPGVSREQLRGDDDPPGSYTQEYVGALASLQVQFLLAEQVLDAEGIALTDDDRSGVREELDGALPDGTGSLPRSVRDDLVDGLAAFGRLRSEFDQGELSDLVEGAVGEATIVVDSRYGTWDDDLLTVTPPDGPAPPPGAGGDESGSRAG